MKTTFNLLNHPMGARHRRLRWGVLTAVAGFAIGAGLALGTVSWLQGEMEGLLKEKQRLQAVSDQRKRQTQEDKARRERVTIWQRQQAHLERVREHQQALVELHEAVLQEAGRSGWRLERLQIESDRLELQGHASSAQVMAAAQMSLSHRLQRPLTLVSMASLAPPDVGLTFVWQGGWSGVETQASRRSR